MAAAPKVDHATAARAQPVPLLVVVNLTAIKFAHEESPRGGVIKSVFGFSTALGLACNSRHGRWNNVATTRRFICGENSPDESTQLTTGRHENRDCLRHKTNLGAAA